MLFLQPFPMIRAMSWQELHRLALLAVLFAGFSYAVWTSLHDNAASRLQLLRVLALMPDTEECTT
jgi:predicted component of type VI protein secretion system